MADLLKSGATWLAQQLTDNAAQMVTYQRVGSSVVVPATVGRVNYEVATAEGFQVSVESWDFLIDADQLVIDGLIIAPKAGDRIIVGELAQATVYEVSSPSGGKPADWADAFNIKYRIHTKYVGLQPPQR